MTYPSHPNNGQYDFSGMGPWLFGGLIALCGHFFCSHSYHSQTNASLQV